MSRLDVNFAKMTPITDRVRLQVRLEAFNLFNSPMYDERQYNNDTNSADFGRINRNTTGQSGFQRFVQMGFRSDLLAAYSHGPGLAGRARRFPPHDIDFRHNSGVRGQTLSILGPPILICAAIAASGVQISGGVKNDHMGRRCAFARRLESRGITADSFPSYSERVSRDNCGACAKGTSITWSSTPAIHRIHEASADRAGTQREGDSSTV